MKLTVKERTTLSMALYDRLDWLDRIGIPADHSLVQETAALIKRFEAETASLTEIINEAWQREYDMTNGTDACEGITA